jgi:anti-sigma-K factor RskA
MTNESRRADLANDSGAYVLNALDKNEREDFEAFMAESPELRNEVTELTDTSVLLGLAVEPVTPSADLKANIMSMLASTPQLPREVAPVRTLHAVPSVQDAQAQPNEQPADYPSELNGKARARWFNRPVVALVSAAAAVAIIIGGGGVLVNSINDNGRISQQASALASINAAPDVQRSVATVSTGGKATLVWSEKVGKSALLTTGLDALPSGKTYELWYIDSSGKPTSAGLLDGSSWKVLSGTMSAGDTIGVTVEPAGGSDAPTTKPIVAIATA